MKPEPWQLKDYLAARVQLVDNALEGYLPALDTLPSNLHEAMRYSVFAGGKRIRPILLLAACEAVGGEMNKALPAACALEMVHTYSLIHDDLPAMDDDDFRRGKATNHKVFGESTAILAGDALLTEAFILLSNSAAWGDHAAHEMLEAIHLLARNAGSRGMVGGQVVDMEAEAKPVDLPTLEYIHTHKTGALILAAIEIGAIIGGADAIQRRALCRYGESAGLAFQIADDILDIVADQSSWARMSAATSNGERSLIPRCSVLTEPEKEPGSCRKWPCPRWTVLMIGPGRCGKSPRSSWNARFSTVSVALSGTELF